MTDTVIEKAWSMIGPGDTIKLRLPQQVKVGAVLERKGKALVVQFLDRTQTIPDAKWYFTQWKLYGNDTDEYLCVIEGSDYFTADLEDPEAQGLWMTVEDISECTHLEPKQIRRYLRRGVIPAGKANGIWQVNRDTFLTIALKKGWL